MLSRTDLTDKRMWRLILSKVHPDREGGDQELFTFLTEVKEELERQEVSREQVIGRGRDRIKRGAATVSVGKSNLRPWWQNIGHPKEGK